MAKKTEPQEAAEQPDRQSEAREFYRRVELAIECRHTYNTEEARLRAFEARY